VAAAGDARYATHSVADATHDLYRQYGGQIYAYCLHQLRSREEAEDAVQTTFLNAFRGLQRGTTTRFEQAWLYKIAQNVCIARRSSSGRRRSLESPDDFEILQEVVPSGASAGDGDTLELMGLDAALERMPENQRRAILMREWQGLSYREIGAELNLSQGAVEMLIFRARRTLASALDEPVSDNLRTRKAKTGFSLASLIAAVKGLFTTGVAAKMAAVAVGAAVVGGSTVDGVDRGALGVHRHASARAARPAAPIPAQDAPQVAPATKIQVTVRKVRPATTAVRTDPPHASWEVRPIIVQDVTLTPAQQTAAQPDAPSVAAPSLQNAAPTQPMPRAPQAAPEPPAPVPSSGSAPAAPAPEPALTTPAAPSAADGRAVSEPSAPATARNPRPASDEVGALPQQSDATSGDTLSAGAPATPTTANTSTSAADPTSGEGAVATPTPAAHAPDNGHGGGRDNGRGGGGGHH
jgi:RNA polymerase sigma factor (sigma-70 family)